MKNRYKIGIFWGTVFSGNMGVNALAYSAIYLLEKISQELNVEFEYKIFGNTSNGVFENVELIKDHSLKIGETIIKYQFIPIKYYSVKRPWNMVKPKYFKQLNSLDFVFDIGEGDSFSDIYGIKRFINLFVTKIYAKLLNKKIIFLPQTIGPFKNPVIRKFANYILKRSLLVIPRDNMSNEYLLNNNVSNIYSANIDLAFLLPYNMKDEKSNKTKIGINVSGLLFNGGYNKSNMFNLKFSYENLIKNLIEYFTNDNEIEIHLIGHVFTGKEQRIDDDLHVIKKLKKEYPNVILAPFFKNPVDVKSYISQMDYFMGARMHACIAAFSAGVPTALMAYSRKFEGLFSQSLKYNYVLNMYDLDEDEIKEKIIRWYNDRMQIKEEMKFLRKNIDEQLFKLTNKIKNILSEELVKH